MLGRVVRVVRSGVEDKLWLVCKWLPPLVGKMVKKGDRARSNLRTNMSGMVGGRCHDGGG